MCYRYIAEGDQNCGSASRNEWKEPLLSSQLMNHQSIKTLQTVLASQVAQKNALVSAVKLACVCRRAESQTSAAEVGLTDTLTTNYY